MSTAERIIRINRFVTIHLWVQAVICVAGTVSLVSAGAVAVTGRESSALHGLVGLPGVVWPLWQIYRGGWELTRNERAAVRDAKQDGRPTGDPRLDAIADYQLKLAGGARNESRIALSILLLAAAAAPFCAALRTGDAWWLLVLVSTAILLVLFCPALFGESPGYGEL